MNGYQISGEVSREVVALPGVKVELWSKRSDGGAVRLPQAAVTSNSGEFSFDLKSGDLQMILEQDHEPELFFIVREPKGKMPILDTRERITWNVGKGDVHFELAAGIPNMTDKVQTLSGQLVSETGRPAIGVLLNVYGQSFGKDELLGTLVSDKEGRYEWPFDVNKVSSAITLRTLDEVGAPLELSKTQYQLKEDREVNLVVPERLVRHQTTEYASLREDVIPHLNGQSLQSAEENGERRDLSILHQKTGWDARLLALGAKAEGVAEQTGLSVEASYGLLRAGLATKTNLLAFTSSEQIAVALETTNKKGITAVDVDAEVERFDTFRRETIAATPLPGGMMTQGDFLTNHTGLSGTDQEAFLDVYQQQGLRGEQLWQNLREAGVADEKVQGLRLRGNMAYLTYNNFPLMESVQAEVGDDLSRLVEIGYHRAETWADKIDQIPDVYRGENEDELRSNYAADMARKVRLSYPGHVLQANVGEGMFELGQARNSVLAVMKDVNSPDNSLDFSRTPISKIVEEVPTEVTEEALRELKALRNLYQVSPSDETMVAFHRAGLRSAFDLIEFVTPQTTLELQGYGATLAEIILALSKAKQVTTTVYSFFASAKMLADSPSVALLDPPARRQETLDKLRRTFPTLENLFGSLDFCECEHCRSVLSPAAYLVDLLQFLDKKPTSETNTDDSVPPPTNPYDVLIGRRPDIIHLELNCENTNTVVPYIDVVNEILEYYIANEILSAENTINTPAGADAADLLAEPQNVLAEAYEILAEAAYPLDLPFDLWTTTVRSCADHFGYPLWKLREIFGAPTAEATDFDLAKEHAREYLGLSPAQYRSFTDPDWKKWWELYGLTADNEVEAWEKWWEIYGFTADEGEGEVIIQQVSAKTLSRKLGVTYKELTELVKTCFLNPKLGVLAESDDLGGVLLLNDPGTACSFDETTLGYSDGSPATKADLLKINFFVRLQKYTGWSRAVLDNALVALLPGEPDELTVENIHARFATALLYLAQLKRLDDKLDLGKSGLATLPYLWQPLDAGGTRSRYAKLFLNPVMLAEDPDFGNLDGLLKDHLEMVQSGFNLTAREIEIVMAASGYGSDDPPARLSMEVLSTLYRHKLLADGLKMELGELVTLKELSGLDPFTPLSGATVTQSEDDLLSTQTIAFVELAQKTRDGSLSMEDIDYLVRHRRSGEDRLRTDWTSMLHFARNVRQEVRRIYVENADPDPTDPDTLTEAEKALRKEERAQRITAYFQEAVAAQFGTDVELSRFVLSELRLEVASGEYKPVGEVLNSLTAPNLEVEQLADGLSQVTLASTRSTSTRTGYFQVPTDGEYIFSVAATTASSLRFNDLTEPLLETDGSVGVTEVSRNLIANTPYRYVLEVDRNSGGENDFSLTIAGEGLQGDAVGRIDHYDDQAIDLLELLFQSVGKAVLLSNKLNLPAADLRFLHEDTNHFASFDLNALPLTGAAGIVNVEERFKVIIDVLDYAKLCTALSPETEDLLAFVRLATSAAPSDQAVHDQLGELLRQPVEGVTEVIEHFGFRPAQLGHPAQLARVWKALKAINDFGVALPLLTSVLEVQASGTSSEQKQLLTNRFKNAIKARYTRQNWHRIGPTIFNPIRQAKRDALVAFILHKDSFERREQLFEHFLIDPGMEPVIKSSRIKMALSAIQTFVQRCHLNLEKEVRPSALTASHWAWMKRYRVWEANRKIFLYPENWLEPEFRDDKTHLFNEVEGALLHGNVSRETAEAAFFAYLKNLEKIARLDVRSMHCESPTDNPQDRIIHVLARTYSIPHEHYYRTYSYGEWTPWVPVSTKIDSDHATIIKWRDRVHIFWLTFIEQAAVGEKNGETKKGSLKDEEITFPTPPAPENNVYIQLNWCDYYQGKWSPREVSSAEKKEMLRLKNIGLNFNKSSVFVHSTKHFEGDNEREVRIHISFFPSTSDGQATYRQLESFVLKSKLSGPGFGTTSVSGNTRINPFNLEIKNEYESGFSSMGKTNLSVHWLRKTVEVEGGGSQFYLGGNQSENITEPGQVDLIKSPVGPYFLVMCPPSVEDAARQASTGGDASREALLAPFFFADQENTFYVEPELLETVIEEWEDVVVNRYGAELEFRVPEPILAPLPEIQQWRPVPFVLPLSPFTQSIVELRPQNIDWLTTPLSPTLVDLAGYPVGPAGGLTVVRSPDNDLASGLPDITGLLDDQLTTGIMFSEGLVLADIHTGTIHTRPEIFGDTGWNPQNAVSRIGEIGTRINLPPSQLT